jgi:hypothetical protein
MPGVVDHDQARRISKGIDDDIKVSLPDYMRGYVSSSFAARKRSHQEEAEAKKGCQGSVTSPLLPCHCTTSLIPAMT